MIHKILITLCFALSFYVEVRAEQEVRRAAFPFMAFIYYPDDTIVDETGARYLRGAVLIRADWLVSSAVGPNTSSDEPTGFPRKTLVARAGAVSIDANLFLNEDEDEQEREIIQIVRPFNHSTTQWWYTDISLLKTLLPFNITSAVGIASLVNRQGNVDKTCTILVYAPRDSNVTLERYLMQISVDLMPSSAKNCGQHFVEQTMICASDSDDNKYAYSPNFCQGNSGGPLICDRDVTGIQTYIDNDCKKPYLYQLLSAWENFISCGTEEKCHEKQCSGICDEVNKDFPLVVRRPTITTKYMRMAETPDTSEIIDTTNTTYYTIYSEDNSHILTPTLTPTTLNATDEPITIELTTVEKKLVELTTLKQTTLERRATEVITVEPQEHTCSDQMTTKDQPVLNEISKDNTSEDEIIGQKWLNEKSADRRRAMEIITENSATSPKIEAREEDKVIGHKRDEEANNARQTSVLNHNFIFGYLILSCLM